MPASAPTPASATPTAPAAPVSPVAAAILASAAKPASPPTAAAAPVEAPKEGAAAETAAPPVETPPGAVAAETQPPENETPKPSEQDATAKRFAALSRKEREIVQQQQQLKTREAELAKQADALRAWEQARNVAKSNPLEALKALGITYEDVTAHVLAAEQSGTVDVKALVKEELSAFEQKQQEERERAERAAQERAAAEAAQVIESFKAGLGEFIEANAEKYELTAAYGQSSLVYEVIETHFQSSGKVLSNDEAAELVERYLEEQAEKALQTRKLQTRLAPAPSAPSAPSSVSAPPATTLSNELHATTPAATSAPPLTREERKARILERYGR